MAITAQGQSLLRGDSHFSYRRETLHGRNATSGRKSAGSSGSQVDLDSKGTILFDRLKALRLRLAKARDVPAYVIFSDKTLLDMASRAPTDREAFAAVNGVGQAKLRDFAEPFLEAIAAAEAMPEGHIDEGSAIESD